MFRSGAKSWWGVDLPKHIAYLYKPIGYEKEWTERTYAEIFAQKKQKQDNDIWKKRAHCKQVPCYIYVWYFDSDFLFGGWYVLVQTRRYGDWYLNWKVQYKQEGLLEKVMRMINVGVFPELKEMWFEAFCRKYAVLPRGCHTKRGICFAKGVFDEYNELIDIKL